MSFASSTLSNRGARQTTLFGRIGRNGERTFNDIAVTGAVTIGTALKVPVGSARENSTVSEFSRAEEDLEAIQAASLDESMETSSSFLQFPHHRDESERVAPGNHSPFETTTPGLLQSDFLRALANGSKCRPAPPPVPPLVDLLNFDSATPPPPEVSEPCLILRCTELPPGQEARQDLVFADTTPLVPIPVVGFASPKGRTPFGGVVRFNARHTGTLGPLVQCLDASGSVASFYEESRRVEEWTPLQFSSLAWTPQSDDNLFCCDQRGGVLRWECPVGSCCEGWVDATVAPLSTRAPGAVLQLAVFARDDGTKPWKTCVVRNAPTSFNAALGLSTTQAWCFFTSAGTGELTFGARVVGGDGGGQTFLVGSPHALGVSLKFTPP